MEKFRSPIEITLSHIDTVLERPITDEEKYWVVRQFRADLAQDGELKQSLDKEEFDREVTKRILSIIRQTLGLQEQRELIRSFAASTSFTIEEKTAIRVSSSSEKKYPQVQEKLDLNKEKSAENIAEKEQEIDKRIVVMQTSGGFGSFDTTNSKNEGAGATYDVRPANDPSRYHFYDNYQEVHEKWNGGNKPFTFIYNRDGKKYLYATAGLNAYSGESNGGRDGNVFVSIELTEDLSSWVEEYILKKAIDLANKKFGKDFKEPIEFKEEYLSKLIT